MGVLCCANKKLQTTSQEIETEKEISIPSFTSNSDKELSKLEVNYNLLKEVTFSDFVCALTRFNMDNATVPEDYATKSKSYSQKAEYYNESFSADMFQSFIENKVFKHPQIYTKAGENEILSGICKETLLEVHKSLASKLNQYAKDNNLPKDPDVIKKYHIMAIGLLYCSGSNISKIRFLFELFNEEQKLVKSEALKKFLLALYLIPAYCMIFARNKVGGKFNEIGEFDKLTLKTLLDACELKDSIHLVDVTLESLFPIDQGLNYEQFKSLFERKEDSVGWVINAKGVRSLLEKNNV